MKNFLKNLGLISLVCVLALMAISCGSEETPEAGPVSDAKVTIEEQVLVDRDGIKVTATGLTNDYIWGDGINLLVENNREENISVSCDAVIVNDFMIFDMFYCDVAAGKKSNEVLYLSSDDLKEIGIDNYGKIECDFYVINSDTYERIFEHEFVTVKTNLFEQMDSEIDTNGSELYNSNDIKITAKGVEKDDLFGSNVVLYIENNSGKNVTISCDDMSVNGFMITPMLSSTVYSGKKAIDEITIFESDLDDNGIEKIEEIELSFQIYNADDIFETIDETGPISFSVN